MKTAALHTTLVFYDGPELFVAKDKFGVHYLSLAVPEGQRTLYASVPLACDDLAALLKGSLSLRAAMRRGADEAWYLSDAIEEGFDQFGLLLQERPLPEFYLPEEIFDLANWLPEPSELGQLALMRGRPVIGIRVDPPESSSAAKIRANTLAALLIEFQKLVRHAKRKVRQKKSERADNSIDFALNTLAFGRGSFRVYFESAGDPDLFGGNDIENALTLINEIMEKASNTDDIVEALRQMGGHFVASLRRLLEILDANDTFLEVDWTTPGDKIRTSRIARAEVAPLLAKLKETESLSKEIRTYVGHFLRVDVSSGSWRLKTSDGEEIAGRSNDPHVLSGAVIETTAYSIFCEEEIEEDLVSGRERQILTLIDRHQVGSNA